MTPISIDAEFRGLITGDVKLQAFFVSDRVLYVEILPHAQDNFFHCVVVDSGHTMKERTTMSSSSRITEIESVGGMRTVNVYRDGSPFGNAYRPTEASKKRLAREIISRIAARKVRIFADDECNVCLYVMYPARSGAKESEQ